MAHLVGRAAPPVAFVGASLAFVALPVLVRVWGLATWYVVVLGHARRTDARLRAWLAKPDATAMHVTCVRVAGEHVVCRAVDSEKEVFVPIDQAIGYAPNCRAVLFDPVLIVDDAPPSGYRDLPRERAARCTFVRVPDRDRAMSMHVIEAVLSIALVIGTHLAMIGVSVAAVQLLDSAV